MKLFSYYRSTLSRRSDVCNWREYDINPQMIYSHRSTDFNRATYPNGLHFHDYYEVVIFVEGDIRYICESNSCLPKYGDVIIIPPGKLHMSMITSESTHYARYVFYLYPDAFDFIQGQRLLNFLNEDRGDQFVLTLNLKRMEDLLMLLNQLDAALRRGEPEDRTLAVAFTLQIFYLLNKPADLNTRSDSYLPASVIDIQRYLDEHFTEISSVSQVAEHFFYSREYVSRLFKRYLNTTVAEYVLNRRVSYSQKLMNGDLPLIDICFRSGFGSVSSFIRAFQRLTGFSPSKYRRMFQESK